MATNECMIKLLERVHQDINHLQEGKTKTVEGFNILDRLYADNKILKLHIKRQWDLVKLTGELKYRFFDEKKKTILWDMKNKKPYRESKKS